MLRAPPQTDFGSFPLNPWVSISISTRADSVPLRYQHTLCVLIAWRQHISNPNPMYKYMLKPAQHHTNTYNSCILNEGGLHYVSCASPIPLCQINTALSQDGENYKCLTICYTLHV